MRQTKLVGLVIATTLAVAAFAAELKHIQVPSSKGVPELVVVYSGKEVIAELKVIKPGTLGFEAGNITWRSRGGKSDYSCTDGCKLELLAVGKSVLKVSGDRILIQGANENLKVK